MPRSSSRGGGSYGGGSRSSFGGSPSRSYSTGRPSSPPPPPPKTPQSGNSGQPSVMKQVATTAAGVAAGSLLASAILGASRESLPPGADCSNGNCRIPDDDPCALELRNFIDCAYQATEITQCDGFNTLLKECRRMTDRQNSRR